MIPREESEMDMQQPRRMDLPIGRDPIAVRRRIEAMEQCSSAAS
jgi:hypothetical protein